MRRTRKIYAVWVCIEETNLFFDSKLIKDLLNCLYYFLISSSFFSPLSTDICDWKLGSQNCFLNCPQDHIPIENSSRLWMPICGNMTWLVWKSPCFDISHATFRFYTAVSTKTWFSVSFSEAWLGPTYPRETCICCLQLGLPKSKDYFPLDIT